MRRSMMTAMWLVAILTPLSMLLGARDAFAQARTYYGAPTRIGQGTLRTWVSIDRRGRPVEMGVRFPNSLLNGLPGQDTEFPLTFPRQAGRTAINHFVLNWYPRGHTPAIYKVPHFDFHYYLISRTDRDRITGVGADLAFARRTPQRRFIPPGYIATPDVIPRMGVHWVPANAPELHGRSFTQTPIYGFYGGRMIFIEPMITREFFLSRQSLRAPLALPARYPRRGYYPTGYAIRYNARRGDYTVALTGFRYH